MGANRMFSALQRLIGHREDDIASVFEFRPLGQKGVRLFSNNTVLPIVHHPGLSVKDVCEQAARTVGIHPVNLPFFTLVTVDGGHVINLQKKLTAQECNQDYELRFMFKGARGSRFADSGSRDGNTLKYLFHQCRHDFLQSHSTIEFSLQDEKSRQDFVRVIICEIIFLSRMYDKKACFVLDNSKYFKIHHLLQRGLYANRKLKEVKSHLRKFLYKFEKLDDLKLKREYIHYIESSRDYFVYTFNVHQMESFNEGPDRSKNYNDQYKLMISPKFAIKKKRIVTDPEKAEHAIVVVDGFEKVTMLEIDQMESTKIYISRTEGSTEVFFAQSHQDAQSIVAIIDGYCKLHANRYKVLINQGRHSPVKIHGPIKRQRAESKIQQHGFEDGLFLIRQSRDCYDEYILSLYFNKKFEHYKIFKQDGEYFLENTTRRFQDLHAFMKYHEKNKDGLVCCLSRNCPPSDEGLDALLDNQQDVPTSERPQDLSKFEVETIKGENIKQLTEIGQGGFGKVIQADWTRYKRENAIKVAIRLIKKGSYDEKFFSVVRDLLNDKYRHPNIVRCYGMVKMKYGQDNVLGLVLEYCCKPLDIFLLEKSKRHPDELTLKLVVQYASQVAEGMMFLQEEMGYTHGGLNAQAILVPKDPSNIKISDVGLIELKQNGGQFYSGKGKLNRHCWHAPELLVTPDSQPTHSSDVWALGVTIWEMFAIKKPFHYKTGEPLKREQILTLLTTRDKYLDTDRNSIPKEVASVIEECWTRLPEDRISFQRVMDRLRGFLQNKDAQESLSKLLTTDDTYVESWEKQAFTTETKTTELLPATDADGYSMVASEKSAKSKPSTLSTPAPSNGTSRSLTNLQFVPRKESIHRTLSDPVSPTNNYEPLMEKIQGLLERPSSLSQLLSSPPSDQTCDDNKDGKQIVNATPDICDYVINDRGSFTTHSTSAQGQGNNSDTYQIIETDSPTDESPPETHPHLSSVSSVEDKAMTFLQGLHSEQRSSSSIQSPLPTSNQPPSGTSKDNLTSASGKLNLVHQETPEMTQESNSATGMDLSANKQQGENFCSPHRRLDSKVTTNTPIIKSTTKESSFSDGGNTGYIQLKNESKSTPPYTTFLDNQALRQFVNFHLEDSEHSDDESFSEDAHDLQDHHVPENELWIGYNDDYLTEKTPSDNDSSFPPLADETSTSNYVRPECKTFTPVQLADIEDMPPDTKETTQSNIVHGNLQSFIDHHFLEGGAEKAPHITSPLNYVHPDTESDSEQDSKEPMSIVDGNLLGFIAHHFKEEDNENTSFNENPSLDEQEGMTRCPKEPTNIDHDNSHNNKDPKTCIQPVTTEASGTPSTSDYVHPESGDKFKQTSTTISTDKDDMTKGSKESTIGGSLQSFIAHHLNGEDSVPDDAEQDITSTVTLIHSHNANLINSASDVVQHSSFIDKDPSSYVKPVITQEVRAPSTEHLVTEIKLGTGEGDACGDGNKSKVQGGQCEQGDHSAITQQNALLNNSSFPASSPIDPVHGDTEVASVQDSSLQNNGFGSSGSIVQQGASVQEVPQIGVSSSINEGFFLVSPFNSELPPDGATEPTDEDSAENSNTTNTTSGGWFCDTTNIDQNGQEIPCTGTPAFGFFDVSQSYAHEDPTMEDIDHSIQPLPYQQKQQNQSLAYVKHSDINKDVPSASNWDQIEQIRSASENLQEAKKIVQEHHDSTVAQPTFGNPGNAPLHDLSMLMQTACSSQDSDGIEMTVMPTNLLPDISMENTGSSSMDSNEDKLQKSSIEALEEDIQSSFMIEKQNLRFEKNNRLGHGNFGDVRKATLTELKFGSNVPKETEVAVKELLKTADGKSKEDFFQEARSMARLSKIDNTNIIKFIGICIVKEEDKVMIVTELAPLGNLKDYLKQNCATIRRNVLLDYCVQICSGMVVLEREEILHRDLALRNILVVRQDLVKISDFGLSKLSEYYKSKEPGERKWPLKWYAPESIDYESRFTSKSDVWGLGVTMWEVFTCGDSPYHMMDPREVIHYIKDGNRLPCPEGCPDDIYQIMMQCWIEDPNTRPSFYYLLRELNHLKLKYRCDQDFNEV